METYASSSLVLFRVKITPPEGRDPTGDPVQIAFSRDGTAPAVADPGWAPASWEAVIPVNPPLKQFYHCRTMIGPSPGHTIAVGTYQVWVRITDNPEAPVIPAGQIRIV